MKKLVVIAVLLMGVVLSGSVFAGEKPVNVREFGNSYVAPKLTQEVKPERVFYTQGQEVKGFVTLELLVNEEGNVELAKVIYETSKLAVPKAMNAVSQWKFDPATVDGKAVKTWVAYNVPFGDGLDIFVQNDYSKKIIIDDVTYALGK